MKKILIIIIILITTSCTKYTDLKNLSIIKSIGISYNNGYTIYAELYEDIKKNEIPKMKIIKTIGNELSTAFKNIKKMISNEILFSHIDLLIFDSQLKTNNYQEIIDYFINNNFRNDYQCILSNDIEKLLNNSKYNEVENIINANAKSILFDEFTNNFLEKKEFFLLNINYENNNISRSYYHFTNNKLERIFNE